jgi:MoaD family protein
MKINLDIRLVPPLRELAGKDQLEFEFKGGTIQDMIDALIEKYGPKAREALYDSKGHFDGMIQIVLNKERWIASDKLDTQLEDEDNIALMLLIGGG